MPLVGPVSHIFDEVGRGRTQAEGRAARLQAEGRGHGWNQRSADDRSRQQRALEGGPCRLWQGFTGSGTNCKFEHD